MRIPPTAETQRYYIAIDMYHAVAMCETIDEARAYIDRAEREGRTNPQIRAAVERVTGVVRVNRRGRVVVMRCKLFGAMTV